MAKVYHNRRAIVLALSAAIIIGTAGCDEVKEDQNQDVYTRLEDCVADWGDKDLCERQIDRQIEQQKAQAAQAGSSAGGGSTNIVPVFLGPLYTGSERSYTYPNGSVRRPMSYYSGKEPVGIKGRISSPVGSPRPAFTSSAVKPSIATSTSAVSRSSFGSTGRSMSTSSGG